MRLGPVLAAGLACLPAVSRAAAPAAIPVVGCIESAASAYRLPPAVIVILLSVEGGSLGLSKSVCSGREPVAALAIIKPTLI